MPAVPAGVCQVPSARRKLDVPPPLNGVKPFRLLVKVSKSVVACVPVNASTLPVAAVTRPKMVPVATCDILARLTALAAMVLASAPAMVVTSPVKAGNLPAASVPVTCVPLKLTALAVMT